MWKYSIWRDVIDIIIFLICIKMYSHAIIFSSKNIFRKSALLWIFNVKFKCAENYAKQSCHICDLSDLFFFSIHFVHASKCVIEMSTD